MTKSATRIQDKDSQKRLSVVRSTEDPTKYWVVILNPDGSKIRWPQWEAATVDVGTTTTWQPWTNASVVNSGTTSDAILDFTIPRWDKWEAATIAVWTVTTWEEGTNASIVNSWTSSDAVFDFTIPRGDTWTAATIEVWTVSTWAAWSSATVTNSWTSSAAVFDFSIPQWVKWDAATVSVWSTTTWNPWTNASVTNSWTSSDAVFNFTIPQWVKWDTGTAATIAVWTTTTGQPWTDAIVSNSWTSSAAVFDFTIPQGEKGDTWTAATIAVGTTSTLPAWSSATVTNSGTSSAATFNFGIPKWEKWDKWDTGTAATITAWTTTTWAAWTSASVTNSGTSSAAVFDFTIPKWDKWDTGQTWATGNGIASITSSKSWKVTTVTITETSWDVDTFTVSDWEDWEWAWDVLWPNSSTDWDVVLFDWNTWKLIKDSWKKLPSVINNLTSTSTTDALSAAQWKILDDKIADLQAMWKFLSLWDCTTWLPISFPQAIPYTYSTWDYFLVETVDTTAPITNYRPNWSSYTWTASSTAETDEVEVWDMYIYDGSVWLLQINHWKTVSFANLSWNPDDNAALDAALDAKADISSLATVATTGKSSDLNNDAWFITSSSLPWKATSTTLWTVKLWSSTTQSVSANAVSWTASRTYAIQTNSSDQMVVNVPRTDTTYESKTAASWGTAVSLVTTWEKYTWNNKQNALSTQTAYTSLWTSSKVPQITTNTLWQVTWITEVSINYPSQVSDTAYASSWNWVTWTAPSKNAVYDKISAMDTTISWKQDALSTQTAYSAKGSATKVPQITTNALGQVTGITEVTITQPTKTSQLTNDSWYITSSSLPWSASSSTAWTIKLWSDTTQTTSANAVSTTANRTYSLQTNSSGQWVVNVPWTDTTYESKAAASWGTAVSLVTTGEKYTWNNKQDWLVSGTNIKTVNGNDLLGSGNLTISWLPAWWTNGQIIMMVNWTPTWVTPVDNGFIMQSPDSTIPLKYIYGGTEWDYQALSSYSNDTMYNTVEGGVTPSINSYEWIVAMATAEWYPWTNTIAALNTDAVNVYNMLNSWWHLTTRYDVYAGATVYAIDWLVEEVEYNDRTRYERLWYSTEYGHNWWESIICRT